MTIVTTPFTGWPTAATAVLAGIAADNTRAGWEAAREDYGTAVLGPIRALAAALEPEFGAMRVFRPYRDRRFRPDAEPYRVDAGGAVTTAGGTELSVVLGATALTVRIGRYAFDGAQLRRYRDAVTGPAGQALDGVLAGIVDGPGAVLALGELPALRGTPRGFAADHPRIGLLRLRALHVGRSWPVGSWLATPEPLERVTAAWRVAGPLVAWLDEHVGPARQG